MGLVFAQAVLPVLWASSFRIEQYGPSNRYVVVSPEGEKFVVLGTSGSVDHLVKYASLLKQMGYNTLHVWSYAVGPSGEDYFKDFWDYMDWVAMHTKILTEKYGFYVTLIVSIPRPLAKFIDGSDSGRWVVYNAPLGYPEYFAGTFFSVPDFYSGLWQDRYRYVADYIRSRLGPASWSKVLAIFLGNESEIHGNQTSPYYWSGNALPNPPGDNTTEGTWDFSQESLFAIYSNSTQARKSALWASLPGSTSSDKLKNFVKIWLNEWTAVAVKTLREAGWSEPLMSYRQQWHNIKPLCEMYPVGLPSSSPGYSDSNSYLYYTNTSLRGYSVDFIGKNLYPDPPLAGLTEEPFSIHPTHDVDYLFSSYGKPVLITEWGVQPRNPGLGYCGGDEVFRSENVVSLFDQMIVNPKCIGGIWTDVSEPPPPDPFPWGMKDPDYDEWRPWIFAKAVYMHVIRKMDPDNPGFPLWARADASASFNNQSGYRADGYTSSIVRIWTPSNSGDGSQRWARILYREPLEEGIGIEPGQTLTVEERPLGNPLEEFVVFKPLYFPDSGNYRIDVKGKGNGIVKIWIDGKRVGSFLFNGEVTFFFYRPVYRETYGGYTWANHLSFILVEPSSGVTIESISLDRYEPATTTESEYFSPEVIKNSLKAERTGFYMGDFFSVAKISLEGDFAGDSINGLIFKDAEALADLVLACDVDGEGKIDNYITRENYDGKSVFIEIPPSKAVYIGYKNGKSFVSKPSVVVRLLRSGFYGEVIDGFDEGWLVSGNLVSSISYTAGLEGTALGVDINAGSTSADYMEVMKEMSVHIGDSLNCANPGESTGEFISVWVYASSVPDNLQIGVELDGVPLVSSDVLLQAVNSTGWNQYLFPYHGGEMTFSKIAFRLSDIFESGGVSPLTLKMDELSIVKPLKISGVLYPGDPGEILTIGESPEALYFYGDSLFYVVNGEHVRVFGALDSRKENFEPLVAENPVLHYRIEIGDKENNVTVFDSSNRVVYFESSDYPFTYRSPFWLGSFAGWVENGAVVVVDPFRGRKLTLVSGDAVLSAASLKGDLAWVSLKGGTYSLRIMGADRVSSLLRDALSRYALHMDMFRYIPFLKGVFVFADLGWERAYEGGLRIEVEQDALRISLPVPPQGRVYLISSEEMYPGGTSYVGNTVEGLHVFQLWSAKFEISGAAGSGADEIAGGDRYVFSPNGDGINDVLYVPMKESEHAEVYDLNGRLVARFVGFWDGSTLNGEIPGGLYIVVVKDENRVVSKAFLLVLK